MGFGQINVLQQGIDTQTTQTESAKKTLNTFDDLQKENNSENQQLLQTIIESSDGNDEAIQNGLKDIYKTNPSQKDIQQLLQAIITSGPDFIDQEEITDHWEEIQSKNNKNDLLAQKENEIQIEKAETAKEKGETANNERIIKEEKGETAQENENIEKTQKDIDKLVIAKQNADKIQSRNSETFQKAQEKTEQSLHIDESKLTKSPLTKTDLAKLITLQQHEELRDEDIFSSDSEKQELRDYLSDGSFESLKDNLGIIDSLDDLAQPGAVDQISGMDHAHDDLFASTIETTKHTKEYRTLATNILTSLPAIYYQDATETKIHTSQGHDLLQERGIDTDPLQEKHLLTSIATLQILHDTGRVPTPKQQTIIDYATDILAGQLQSRTTDTIKTSTKQNYLSHTAELFGSMGDDIQTDPSRMSYDEKVGLTIDFGIDGYDFQHPITISDTVTGPNLIDRSQGDTKGKETTTTLGTSLPTMTDLIRQIDISPITHATNYQNYRSKLTDFRQKQADTLREQTTAQRVSVQRYATKLQAHLHGRQLATELNTLDNASNTTDYNSAHIDQQQYQRTYTMLDHTTRTLSTPENRQFAADMTTLSTLPQQTKHSIDFDTEVISDPLLRTLLDRKHDVPNRAEELFVQFTRAGDANQLNTQDIHLFADYAQHVVQTNIPSLTFDQYLSQTGHTLSPQTMTTYNNLRDHQEHISADAGLDEMLNALGPSSIVYNA